MNIIHGQHSVTASDSVASITLLAMLSSMLDSLHHHHHHHHQVSPALYVKLAQCVNLDKQVCYPILIDFTETSLQQSLKSEESHDPAGKMNALTTV